MKIDVYLHGKRNYLILQLLIKVKYQQVFYCETFLYFRMCYNILITFNSPIFVGSLCSFGNIWLINV